MFLNACSSPSEDSCCEELRSSISVASGAGTDLSLSFLVQPQFEQQCKVLSTMSESTCSNSTATVSSLNVEKVTEDVSRKELNTSRDSEESDFRTSDLVELVVDDYANEFDDDICLPYESSTCIEESPASESQVISAVAEANTGSNDGGLKVAVQRPKQGQRLRSQKHGNQSHTQVPSSGEVWLPVAFKSQSSNIGSGAGRGTKAGRVDNEDKSLKKGRPTNRSVKQTGSSTVVSLLDIELKNVPKSRPSGLSATQCNANKNLRFSKPADSGASDKRNFHMIKVGLIDFSYILLVKCIYVSYCMKYNIHNKTSFVDCTFGTLYPFSFMHFFGFLFLLKMDTSHVFNLMSLQKFLLILNIKSKNGNFSNLNHLHCPQDFNLMNFAFDL